jgi:hypothetical protein
MLNQAKLSNSFWPEAISIACYLQNRLGTIALETTPYELWTNQKPNISHLYWVIKPMFMYQMKSVKNFMQKSKNVF